MTYPATTSALDPVRTSLATSLPAIPIENQSFAIGATTLYEVDADGNATTVPLGQSGPFVLTIGAEQILCSSFSEGVCEVYENEGVNGRGWNSSTVVGHTAGAAVVSVSATSVQSVATGGGVQSVVAGTNVTVDDTDPANPIVSASGGGGGGIDVTVNSGAVTESGLLTLAVTQQPAVPPSGVIQPLPPLIGFEFPGQFIDLGVPDGSSSLYGSCVGRDGNLWVTEEGSNLFWRVTPQGVISAFSVTGAEDAYFIGICSGPEDSLYITDQRNNGIWKIALDGSSTFLDLSGNVPQGLICAGPDGNLWTGLLTATAGVIQIAPDGSFTTFTFADYAGEGGVISGPDGNLWLPLYDNGNAYYAGKFSIDGTLLDAFALPQLTIQGCATGPDGNVWFADTGADGVGFSRVTPDGVVTTFASAAKCFNIVAGAGGDMWAGDEAGNLVKLTVDGVITLFETGGVGVNWITAGSDGSFWLSMNNGHVYFFPFTVVMGQLSLTGGPLSTRVLNVSGAPYSMNGTESTVISDSAVQLPDPTLNRGAQFVIKDDGSGTAGIIPFAAETIDGASSVTLAAYEAATVTSDSTNWWVISQVATSVL